jgi:hypothetical protein
MSMKSQHGSEDHSPFKFKKRKVWGQTFRNYMSIICWGATRTTVGVHASVTTATYINPYEQNRVVVWSVWLLQDGKFIPVCTRVAKCHHDLVDGPV